MEIKIKKNLKTELQVPFVRQSLTNNQKKARTMPVNILPCISYILQINYLVNHLCLIMPPPLHTNNVPFFKRHIAHACYIAQYVTMVLRYSCYLPSY